jgi:hypothetical protein
MSEDQELKIDLSREEVSTLVSKLAKIPIERWVKKEWTHLETEISLDDTREHHPVEHNQYTVYFGDLTVSLENCRDSYFLRGSVRNGYSFQEHNPYYEGESLKVRKKFRPVLVLFHEIDRRYNKYKKAEENAKINLTRKVLGELSVKKCPLKKPTIPNSK